MRILVDPSVIARAILRPRTIGGRLIKLIVAGDADLLMNAASSVRIASELFLAGAPPAEVAAVLEALPKIWVPRPGNAHAKWVDPIFVRRADAVVVRGRREARAMIKALGDKAVDVFTVAEATARLEHNTRIARTLICQASATVAIARLEQFENDKRAISATLRGVQRSCDSMVENTRRAATIIQSRAAALRASVEALSALPDNEHRQTQIDACMREAQAIHAACDALHEAFVAVRGALRQVNGRVIMMHWTLDEARERRTQTYGRWEA